MDEDGEKEKDEASDGPVECSAREDEPPEEEEKKGYWLDQAAAEIVEDLPTRDGVDGIGDEFAGLVWYGGKEPSRDLPVATNPAVLTAGMSGVVGRVVVDDFDVGDEAGAGVRAFDEIVREKSVAREAAVEYLVEDVDFVDALAGKDALAEKILIDVGDGAGVDVESGFAGVEGREAGA